VKTNHGINALRFIAALLVVISHIRTLFFVDFGSADDGGPVTQAIYLVGSLGHAAVIVFFVLSGYWVGGSVLRGIARQSFSVKLYAASRLTRLWIVLVPALLLTQLLDRLGRALFTESDIYLGTSAYHTVVPEAGPALDLLTTIGNLFFVQSVYTDVLGTNTPLWSLAYEFWYYLLFPSALLAFAKGISGWQRLLAGLVFIVGATISGPSVLLLFPAWLAGAALAHFQEPVRGWTRSLTQLRLSLFRWGATSILIGGCVATVIADLTGMIAAIVIALPSCVWLASFILDVRSTRLTRMTVVPLSKAADWSYSLYASHMPVVAFLSAWLIGNESARWQVSGWSGLGALGIVLIVTVFAFALSLVTEKHTHPLRNLILRRSI